MAFLVRVYLVAIHRRGITIGLGIALVMVAILLAPEVDVVGIALLILPHEERNDFLD